MKKERAPEKGVFRLDVSRLLEPSHTLNKGAQAGLSECGLLLVGFVLGTLKEADTDGIPPNKSRSEIVGDIFRLLRHHGRPASDC